MDLDRANQRENMLMDNTKLGPHRNNCDITTNPQQLDNNRIANRINDDMVKAFKENPYTQSLNSF